MIVCRVPYERAIRWHRWNSRALLVAIAIHAGLTADLFGASILAATFPLARGSGAAYGTAAACCFAAMMLTSLAPIRRASWEAFKVAHLALFYAGIVLSFLHATDTMVRAQLRLPTRTRSHSLRIQVARGQRLTCRDTRLRVRRTPAL